MGELVERAKRIVAGGAGGNIGNAVGALMVAAGVAAKNPGLAAVGMLAGPYVGAAAQEGILAVTSAWQTEGVQDFVEAVEAETGEGIEDFVTNMNPDRKTRRLFGEAVGLAAESADPQIVRALARAFVKGAKDADRVDAMSTLVDVLREGVQGKHVRVMAVLRTEPYQRTVDAVNEADPGLGHTAAILCRDLDRLGLVMHLEWNIVALTAVGWSCAALLDEIGSLDEELDEEGRSPDAT